MRTRRSAKKIRHQLVLLVLACLIMNRSDSPSNQGKHKISRKWRNMILNTKRTRMKTITTQVQGNKSIKDQTCLDHQCNSRPKIKILTLHNIKTIHHHQLDWFTKPSWISQMPSTLIIIIYNHNHILGCPLRSNNLNT